MKKCGDLQSQASRLYDATRSALLLPPLSVCQLMVSDFSFSVTLSFAFLAIDCDVTLTGGGRKLHESISCVIAISLSWRKQCECVGF